MHADGTYETLALGIGMILSTGYLSNGQSSNTAASAYIDPFIQVDPNWALSHPGHSIIVSNGIGNAAPAAVPVPGALWLFASGLMGLLGLRRRGNNS
jgi:hypothetical protein